jgi:GNAT superfamily N-acetyltransferase
MFAGGVTVRTDNCSPLEQVSSADFGSFSETLCDFAERTTQAASQSRSEREGVRASAASTELDVASSDAKTPSQVSCELVLPLRPSVRQIPRKLTALGADDRIAFRAFLLALDEPSRFSRFSCVMSDDGIARHALYAASEAAWIAGMFAGEELCGVVELYESREPRDVEAAFVVATARRRQGVGTALLFAALRWAQRSDRARLRMIFSRRHWAMRRLTGKAGASLDLDEFVADVVVGEWRADTQSRPEPPRFPMTSSIPQTRTR